MHIFRFQAALFYNIQIQWMADDGDECILFFLRKSIANWIPRKTSSTFVMQKPIYVRNGLVIFWAVPKHRFYFSLKRKKSFNAIYIERVNALIVNKLQSKCNNVSAMWTLHTCKSQSGTRLHLCVKQKCKTEQFYCNYSIHFGV